MIMPTKSPLLARINPIDFLSKVITPDSCWPLERIRLDNLKCLYLDCCRRLDFWVFVLATADHSRLRFGAHLP